MHTDVDSLTPADLVEQLDTAVRTHGNMRWGLRESVSVGHSSDPRRYPPMLEVGSTFTSRYQVELTLNRPEASIPMLEALRTSRFWEDHWQLSWRDGDCNHHFFEVPMQQWNLSPQHRRGIP